MTLYRLIFALALPLIAVRLLWRRLTGRESARGLAERFGHGPAPAPARRIWLHGASNGELASAATLVGTLLRRSPELHLVVTANTETGRDLVESWGADRIATALAPIDTRRALRRFLDRWQPAALIGIENEIWPLRFHACAKRGVPVFILSARISDRSARGWARLLPEVMAPVRHLSAQDAASQARFVNLGLAPDRLGPLLTLKSSLTARAAADPLPTPHDTTVLAASTHEGEDQIVLDAFLRARAARPELRLILAPRHPRRRDAIEALIRARGLTFATRSRAEEPAADLDVYLADTLGEMDRWYAGAGITFVGGSLVEKGGHTPFEPAAYGSAILHGPHVANAAPVYAALDAAGGAVEVRDAASLADAILVLTDPGRQKTQAAHARGALASFRSDAALAPFFDALAGATGLPLATPEKE